MYCEPVKVEIKENNIESHKIQCHNIAFSFKNGKGTIHQQSAQSNLSVGT